MYHVEHGHLLFEIFYSISHLQNVSSYEIAYGNKLSAISDLQLEGDDFTHPAFYHFTDYLYLLNEHIRAIRDIVKEHHSQTIQKRLQQHGSESPTLRSFNEGDIVYCHFPCKTIISDLKLPSKTLQISYVGPLYIFSKHDKFLYLLSTIDGEVIERIFHVSRLIRGLLRLPNGKSVKSINNYKLEKIRQHNENIQPAQHAPDSSQTSVKTVMHIHHDVSTPICQDTDTSDI